VAVNGCGMPPTGGIMLIMAPESPPHALSIQSDTPLSHRTHRIAGYLASMRM
jgi:hypothetical protein